MKLKPNGSFYWLLKALLSHYWRRPWQSLFLMVGLVAGVGLWSAVQIINQQAESSYQQAQSLLGVQANYWIRSRQGKGVDQAIYIQLRREGFVQIFPIIEIQVSNKKGDLIEIIATDLLALPSNSHPISKGSESFGDTWLKFTQPPFRLWVASGVADEFNLKAGEQLKLRDGRLLPPAMIQTTEQQGRRLFMDIAPAQELQGSTHLSYLVVGDINVKQFARLNVLLPDHLELVENQQQLDLTQLTASLHSHLTAMSLLSFAVGMFIVFNAVRFSLTARRATMHDLGLMGCDMRQMILAIILETLVWSFLGSLLGFLCGIVLANALLPSLGSSLQSLYGATVDSLLLVKPWSFFQAWLITLFGLFWALAWPLYLQLKTSSMAINNELAITKTEQLVCKRLALVSLVLGLLALVLFWQLETVNQGFILLGLILFSAAMILPALLMLSLRLLASFSKRKFFTRWMLSDAYLQLPSLRAAMMALLLALTANQGVGTLVDSFRVAFVGWLELRQSADIYLRGSNFDYDKLVETGFTQKWLKHSHQRIGVHSRFNDRPALIRGADTGAPDSLVFPLAQWSGESANQALKIWREKTGSVLINEQLHYLAGLNIGDTLNLKTDSGFLELQVVGIFYDYGNPEFQFYLPQQLVKDNWHYYYSSGMALWLDSTSQPANEPSNEPEMQQALAAMQKLGAQPGDWISQEEVRNLSVGIFDKTFAITAAMNLLTLVVAAIALLASLLAILQQRLPQFAQWRALGLRQSEQLLIVATPLFIFAGVVYLLSIPLGALLSWVLIHQLNVISFGWSMPLVWQLIPALQLGLLVVLIIGLSLLLVSIQWRRRLPQALAQISETG